MIERKKENTLYRDVLLQSAINQHDSKCIFYTSIISLQFQMVRSVWLMASIHITIICRITLMMM